MKSIILHVGALAVSSALALSVWLRDEEADQPKSTAVEVWGGRPETVESIAFESSSRKGRVEPRKDALGRWYVTRFERIQEQPADPHTQPSAPQSSAAPSASAAPAPPPAPKPPPKISTETFVSVKEAEELVKKLAPLMALRSVGKIDPKQASDFGLDKPDGTLKVKIAGKEHVLTVGGQTPGGGERYAKYAASGEVFAIPGELTQALVYADSRLMERDLHAFATDEVEKLKISKGGKSRNLVRVAGKQNAWADAATPTKADETLSNWLTKLERVRITDYVEKPSTAPRPEHLVVRVDYSSKSKELGYLELYKVPGEKDPEYLARTEYGRWYTKVVPSAAEQVDRDLGSILK